MPATAQIIIEVDDTQATGALKRVSAEGTRLGGALQPVQKISEQTFNNIEGGALKARESAALLGEEFGVKLPRALRGTLAESSLIGPALTAAFSVLGPAGIAAVAVTAIGDIIEQIQSLRNASANAILAIQREAFGRETTMLEAQQTKNLELRVKTETEGANELLKLDARYHAERQALINEELKAEEEARLTKEHDVVDLANKNLLQLDRQYAAERRQLLLKQADDVREASDAETAASKRGRDRIVADAKTAIDRISALENQGAMLHAVAEAKRAQITAETGEKIVKFDEEVIEKQRALEAQGQREILRADAAASSGREQIEKEYLVKLNEITMREVQETLALKKQGIDKEIVLDKERTAARMEENQKLLELARQRADEERQLETAAAIASLPPWQRADAQIVADAEERIRKIREMEAKDATFREQGEREVGLIIQKEWHERVENMASQLESVYDEISSGGIKQFFIKQFKHMVFEMVAAWIIGMNQMRAASQQQMGSGGGILGAIFGSLGLGGIFGDCGWGGGQGGISSLPGVITNFGGGNGDFGGETNNPAAIGGVGLSAGLGGGLGTIMPSGSGPGGGAGGPIGSLLGKLFSHGAGPISGTMLATLGIGLLASNFMGGGILHALGGAAGGALTGFAIAGPLGALVGGIVGFFSGLFSHSTRKARLAIEADIKRKAATIEDSYNLFQSDWSSSRDALEQLRQQGVDALRQAGVKDINRSRVGHVDHWIDKAEKEIDATQAERNRRGALAFGPAQFRVGGFVGGGIGGPAPAWFAASATHYAAGGAVPAILHEGEYVMRPEAVSMYGRARMERINSGRDGGGVVHNHYHINALDAKSVSQLFRRMQLEGNW